MLCLHNNELKCIPSEISNLSGLTYLYLDNNKLKSIPPEMGKLNRLRYLHLQGNKLTSLPHEIGMLRNLCYLHVHNNRFRSIPLELVNLRRLESITVQSNNWAPITGVTRVSCHFPKLVEICSLSMLNWPRIPNEGIPEDLIDMFNLAKNCTYCKKFFFLTNCVQNVRSVDILDKTLPHEQFYCSTECNYKDDEEIVRRMKNHQSLVFSLFPIGT